jgi:hypothetical protein
MKWISVLLGPVLIIALLPIAFLLMPFIVIMEVIGALGMLIKGLFRTGEADKVHLAH